VKLVGDPAGGRILLVDAVEGNGRLLSGRLEALTHDGANGVARVEESRLQDDD
jgi:hypothetical protein